jgi:ATP-dependent Clp protease ATP-binding subunit ClpB
MLARQGLVLRISEQALDWLADLGYDPQFGARPMKRVLQKELINELSKLVLDGTFSAGDTIYIDAPKDELTFGKEPFAGAAKVPKSEAEKKEEQKAEAKAKEKTQKKEEAKAAIERKKQLKELEQATNELEDTVKDLNKDEA